MSKIFFSKEPIEIQTEFDINWEKINKNKIYLNK